MKIHKISSNISTFRNVTFKRNFSIILGVPESRGIGKSHNLGKTTLISLIDNLLFGARNSGLAKAIKGKFQEPVFYVDLLIGGEKSRVTVDFSKIRKNSFSPDIRESYEYFIRYQDDYTEEFRKKSIRGKDITWKPRLMRLVGFDETQLIEKYEVESTIKGYENFIEHAEASGVKRKENGAGIAQLEARREMIVKSIDTLNFSDVENSTSIELASVTDPSISDLKRRLFVLRKEFSSVNEALEHDVFVDFSPEGVERVYSDLGLYFGDQIKRDFSEVSSFFVQITKNRTAALSAMKKKIFDQISAAESELTVLTQKRAEKLKMIVSQSSVDIYRDLSTQLAQTEIELSLLQQDVFKDSIQTATSELNLLQTKQLSLAAAVAIEIDKNDEKFCQVKEEYRQIMLEVMDIDAEIIIEKNSTGNINFRTVSWRQGKPTEELKGDMAKRISCVAFDVALRIVNNEDKGFIIHDGVIDNADKNITQKFISAMKLRAVKHDFQYIITAIADDLPDSALSEDVVVTLSDGSDADLLFGMKF